MSNADTDRRLGSLCGNGDLVMLRRMLSLNRMFERCWRTSRHRHPHQSNGMRAIRFLAAGAAHIASTMTKQLYRAVHRTDWRFGWIVAHFGNLLGRVVSNRLCRILERLPRVWSGTLCRIIDRGPRCTRLRTTQSAEALLDARVGGCHGFGLRASSPAVRRHPSPNTVHLRTFWWYSVLGAKASPRGHLMNVTTVESTSLATVAYDDARKLLQLEFCGRAIYQYFSGGGARSPAAGTLQGHLLQSGHSWTLRLCSGLECPGSRTACGAPVGVLTIGGRTWHALWHRCLPAAAPPTTSVWVSSPKPFRWIR